MVIKHDFAISSVHVLFYVLNKTGGIMNAPDVVNQLSSGLLDLKKKMQIIEIRTYGNVSGYKNVQCAPSQFVFSLSGHMLRAWHM